MKYKTSVAKNRDYRTFGNMLFDSAKDPFEIKNIEYLKTNQKLMKYYDDFKNKISSKGKSESIKANEK